MAKLKNVIVILIVLAITGWSRMPIEQQLAEDLHELKLVPPRLSLEDRSRLKQKAFIATYGSLRPTIAAFMSSATTRPHSNQEWDKVEDSFEEILLLDPYNFHYWDMASWHMAYNAAIDKKSDESLTEVARNRVFERYIQKGKDIIDRGIEINPDDWRFQNLKANLEGNRFRNPDYPAAIETHKQMLTMPDLPYHAVRQANIRILFNTQNLPERHQEAYDIALELFARGGQYRTPIVLNQLFISNYHPLTIVESPMSLIEIYGSEQNALKHLRTLWRNRKQGPKIYGVEKMIKQLEKNTTLLDKKRTIYQNTEVNN